VHPHFNADTRTSVDNTWYAIGDKASADFGLSQAQLLRKTPLFDYGVDFFELGEWQRQRNAPGDYGDALGFGESEVDDTLYPKGVAHLCKAYHDLGFGCSFGANYAYAAHSTSTAAASWLRVVSVPAISSVAASISSSSWVKRSPSTSARIMSDSRSSVSASRLWVTMSSR